MFHILATCPQNFTKEDIENLVFKLRHNKAPVIWAENLLHPDYEEYLKASKPWTAEFSRQQDRNHSNGKVP